MGKIISLSKSAFNAFYADDAAPVLFF